jgi:hypothetical protein
VESGSKGTPVTRILALLVESGAVYIVFWVCPRHIFNDRTVKLREPQIMYIVSNFELAMGLSTRAFISDICGAVLVSTFPLDFHVNKRQLTAALIASYSVAYIPNGCNLTCCTPDDPERPLYRTRYTKSHSTSSI